MSDVLPPFIINFYLVPLSIYMYVHLCLLVFVSQCGLLLVEIKGNIYLKISIYVVVIADAAPSLPRSHLVGRLAAVVVSLVRDVVDELPLKPPSRLL